MAGSGKFDARGRLARVLAAVRKEPTGALPTSQVRIKLGQLPAPLRAIVRNESHGGMLIEAELPWLTVGSDIQAEMPDGREKAGRVHWFGVDATSAGSARLRIFVDLSASNEGVPAKLPDAAELAGRPRRWPWALATLLLMIATAAVVYVLARRPPQPALMPSPVPVEPIAPTPAPAVTVPKEAPAVAAPPAAAAPPATRPTPPAHPKPKRKRR